MFRTRLLIVVLIAALWAIIVPLPAPAAARIPTTVDRTFELARGQRLNPSRTFGVSTERIRRRLPIQANLVAMSFRTNTADLAAVEEGITITARFHTKKGWGAWDELHLEPEEAPDDASQEGRRASDRVFTAPIWVGTADAMIFRASAAAGAPAFYDLRAHVINTLGDSRPPSVLNRIVGTVASFLRGGGSDVAEAMTSTPKIISRRSWGANESWRECCPRYASTVHMAWVHHTAGTNSYSKSESAAIVRSVYKFHTSNRGWSDIGYNFLIDRYGQIFEGRYGGTTKAVIGAHVKGFNTGTTGVSLMGTFATATPPTAMQSALKRLLAWKLDIHHVPPTGKVTMTSGGNPKYPTGRRVSFNRISGHRDGQQTSCPGTKMYYLLPSIRSAVNSLGRPKIYLPITSSGLLRPDGNGVNDTITVRATFTQELSWGVEFFTNGGTPIRKLIGRGTSMAAVWDGKNTGGALADYTGVIRYTITAGSSGVFARPASGSFHLVTKHPNGTVLRTPTRTVLIEDGKARPIPSTLVLNSRYKAAEVVTTTDVEVNRYPAGAPLDELREGTLLKEPDGTYAVFSGGRVREFEDGVYASLGYTAASALPVTALQLNLLPSGAKISDSTRHPEGAVVRASDGTVWTIGNGVRRQQASTTMWRTWYRDAELVPATLLDVALPPGTKMTYREGSLFRASDGTHSIFSGGVERRFYHTSLYTNMGYSTAALFAITTTEAKSIPDGPAIA